MDCVLVVCCGFLLSKLTKGWKNTKKYIYSYYIELRQRSDGSRNLNKPSREREYMSWLKTLGVMLGKKEESVWCTVLNTLLLEDYLVGDRK